MGKVIVQDYTYKKPITMIGVEAGICWEQIPVMMRRIISEALTVLRADMGEHLSSLMCI